MKKKLFIFLILSIIKINIFCLQQEDYRIFNNTNQTIKIDVTYHSKGKKNIYKKKEINIPAKRINSINSSFPEKKGHYIYVYPLTSITIHYNKYKKTLSGKLLKQYMTIEKVRRSFKIYQTNEKGIKSAKPLK